MNEPHPSSEPLGPGMMLGQGKYQVVSLLGSGGMGDVYLGRHLALDREVAIKVLRSRTGLSSTEALARFRREALLASRLEHPNVVRVLDFDQENGTAFIVMDLVRGDSLFERVAGTRLELDDLIDIMEKVCAALEAAHQAGLLHRDLKPENILLEPFESTPGLIEERVKVCDFGLAKAYTAEAAANPNARSLTRVGEVSGTPEYMSPEQARGERLDPRSDLYSVGTILYHLAAGRPPYTASSAMAVLMRHVNYPVPRLRDVVPEADPRLERLIMKAMAKEPSDRFQTAAELRSALLSLHSSAAHSTQTPQSLGQLQQSTRTTDNARLTTDRLQVVSPPKRWVAIAVAALLSFGLGVWGLGRLTSDDEQVSSATPTAAPKQADEREATSASRLLPDATPTASEEPLALSSPAEPSPTSEPPLSEPSPSEPTELQASDNGRGEQPERSDSASADRPANEKRVILSTQKMTESGRRHKVPIERAVDKSASAAKQPPALTLSAKASVSHVKVQGGAQGLVEEALEKERKQFEACYRSAAQAARRDAEQTLEVRFSVVANTPQDVRVLGAELLGLNDCIRNVLRRLEGSSLPAEGVVDADIHLTPLDP